MKPDKFEKYKFHLSPTYVKLGNKNYWKRSYFSMMGEKDIRRIIQQLNAWDGTITHVAQKSDHIWFYSKIMDYYFHYPLSFYQPQTYGMIGNKPFPVPHLPQEKIIKIYEISKGDFSLSSNMFKVLTDNER